MKVQLITAGLLTLLVAVPALAEEAGASHPEHTRNRLEHRGDRIDQRLNQRGENIDHRLDQRAQLTEANGHEARAQPLDKRGDRVENRLDKRGDRAERRLDRRGARAHGRAAH